MTLTVYDLDLEKESQDDWLPRFLSSGLFMEAPLTPMLTIPILREYPAVKSSGKESLTSITRNIVESLDGMDRLLKQ